MPVDSTTQASWPEQYAQLCDERDLYRALLVAEPQQLRQFLRQGHIHLEQVQSLLQQPARGRVDFRNKLASLLSELEQLEMLTANLDLPSFQRRFDPLLEGLESLRAHSDATGDDLLPLLEMIDDLHCHLIAASDVRPRLSQAANSGMIDNAPTEGEASDAKLELALTHLSERVAAEYGRQVKLTTRALGLIPEALRSSLFDVLGQLLRNAIEHGIEDAERRAELGKNPIAQLEVDFNVQPGGYRLSVRDDGRGLDTAGLHQAAVRCGLLEAGHPEQISPRQVARLIFAPGVTTSADTARAGTGLQSVREAVRRLGGRIEFSTKHDHFTRFDVLLPRP